MMWLGEQLLGCGRVIPPGEIKRRLSQVTTYEVRAVARDFLRPERLNLALVTSLKPGMISTRDLRI
jgi:predicted Zn-dependent peptidase